MSVITEEKTAIKRSLLRDVLLSAICGFSLTFVFTATNVAAENIIYAARFSTGDLSEWQEKSFKGETRYQWGKNSLCAESENSASARYRKIKIDLEKTPWLNWRWQVNSGIDPNRKEQSKSGDDYPARVYVVFSGGLKFWDTRAINYVWSSNQPIEASWKNAFTSNARMIAVQSGSKKLGLWLQQRRNVLDDFRRLFGDEPGSVDAIAIMTDSDNSSSVSSACYGDIWFSEE